jgi:tripartite-type tricarboxylate transporter receptor subunit TctC
MKSSGAESDALRVTGERADKRRHDISSRRLRWRKEEPMKLPRRQFLQLAAGAAVLPAISRIASAQAYPARPVRWIAGFPPGGPTDTVARLMGQWLSERLGQPFLIENRPGAGGNIAIEAAANASPDGYTLLLVNVASAINATLYEKLNFNLLRDIAPVAGIVRTPLVMAVIPSIPAQTVPEFIAYAKANPGKINMASGGNGAPQHVAGELFKMMAGVNMLHVPYRGEAPALTDMLGGQVQVIFGTMPGTIAYIRTGKLRPLAVTTSTRWEGLADVPTVGDFLPGFEASYWGGVGVPDKTPAEIIDRLNDAINLGLADSKMQARLADLGGTTLAGSPADFRKFIADEIEKWGKVVKYAEIKAD